MGVGVVREGEDVLGSPHVHGEGALHVRAEGGGRCAVDDGIHLLCQGGVVPCGQAEPGQGDVPPDRPGALRRPFPVREGHDLVLGRKDRHGGGSDLAAGTGDQHGSLTHGLLPGAMDDARRGGCLPPKRRH